MSDDSENSSSSESSDSDSELEVDNVLNSDFFKTLSCLKKKDPRIYDPDVKFYCDYEESVQNEKFSNNESINSTIKRNEDNKKSYFQTALEDSEDSDTEDIKFKVEKEESEIEKEPDHISFLKGKKNILDDKSTEVDLKPLHQLWNSDNLDPNEKFLRDYILNKRFLEKDEGKKIDEIDLSEDEKALEEQEEFEDNYNKRFETEENLTIKRFPRNIEGSIRRKNEARKMKRAEIAQRKKEEKLTKHKELKKKQKTKMLEIQAKLNELKEITGNPQLGFNDEEILEDFDPEKHDKKMQELFNDDFYSKEDYDMPIFDNENIDGDNFIMDCDADLDKLKEEKLTRSQRKKNRKKKSFQDVIDIEKPSFDLNKHKDFKKYLDDYYSIDCEDFIDDLPCRFKYKEVVPNDFGLSIEEILMADDKELNQWASLKKLQKLRPEHIERNEVKVFKYKSKNETLKRKIFKSLYTEPEENKDILQNSESIEENYVDSQNIANRNKKKKFSMNISENVESMEENIRKRKSKHSNITQNETCSVSIEGKAETYDQYAESSKKNMKHDNISNESISTDNLSVENTKKETVMNLSNDLTNESKEEISNINDQTNKEANIQQTNMKKCGKKKKKRKNKMKNAQTSQNSQAKSNKNTDNKTLMKNDNTENLKFSKKLKNKFKKTKNNIVNLSDNRLIAYGIKPKKFRSKIIYSQNK